MSELRGERCALSYENRMTKRERLEKHAADMRARSTTLRRRDARLRAWERHRQQSATQGAAMQQAGSNAQDGQV